VLHLPVGDCSADAPKRPVPSGTVPNCVDIDRYIASNQHTWKRLDALTAQASTRISALSHDDLEELLRLYQQVSAQLSFVRTHYREPSLTASLSATVANAHQIIYRRSGGGWRSVTRFFTDTFPAAVWHCRTAVGVSAAFFFLPALIVCLWLLNSPDALEASASAVDRQVYVDDLFEQYYSDRSPLQFFGEVTVNNIWVSLQVFAGAATAGLYSALLIASNGVFLGQAAAWMISEGESARFWGFILPHGMLELSAIVIAGGAAFQLGWALLAPGDRSRADALREEGQRTLTIILGLGAMFFAAGVIEGFITGRGLPVGLRVGVGALGWLAALAYFGLRGIAAARDGNTGLLVAPPRTWDDEPALT